jgi:hypothetical protein
MISVIIQILGANHTMINSLMLTDTTMKLIAIPIILAKTPATVSSDSLFIEAIIDNTNPHTDAMSVRMKNEISIVK